MKDNLPTSSFHINKELVACICDTFFPCDILGLEEHPFYDPLVLLFQIIDAPDMFPRNDQKMDRCGGMIILKDNDNIILIDNISLPLTPIISQNLHCSSINQYPVHLNQLLHYEAITE